MNVQLSRPEIYLRIAEAFCLPLLKVKEGFFITEAIVDLINKFGQSITLEYDGKRVEIKGVLQPLRYKNKLFLNGNYGGAGLNSQSSYVYFGIPINNISEKKDAVINAIGKRLFAVKTDFIYYGDSPLYEWAILKEYKEEEGN